MLSLQRKTFKSFVSTDFTTRALPFTYIFILLRSILNFKVRLGRVCDLVFLNRTQYLFHVNNISRNHKTLQSCVAPSASPSSILILTRQAKLSTELRWLLRSPFKVEPTNFSNFQSFSRDRQSLPMNELLLLLLYFSVG